MDILNPLTKHLDQTRDKTNMPSEKSKKTIKASHTGDSSPEATNIIWWTVAIQTLTKKTHLMIFPLTKASTGEQALESVRHQRQAVSSSACRENWLCKLFTKNVIAIAKVQWVNFEQNYAHTLAALLTMFVT